MSTVLITVVASALGCASADVASPADGAAVDGAGTLPPPPCTTATVCDGQTVRACSQDFPGAVLQICDDTQACSAGRCTTLACAAAERGQSLAGCLIYGALADNTDRDDALPSMVIVVNPGNSDTDAQLLVRDSTGLWNNIETVHVPALGAERFDVPNQHVEGVGVGQALAFRLQSDQPLTATLIESDDRTEMSQSTGGTMLLPSQALGNEYMVMTYPQRSLPELSATVGSHDGAGAITVIGTVDGTNVTVHLSATASLAAGGGLPAAGPGGSVDVMLDDGDVLQLDSEDEGSDLSGSEVLSDNPVVVLAGNILTSYGRSGPGINSPDMALEAMWPVRSWSESYVAARLGPQKDTCDSIFGGASSLWRILAAHDDTHVTFDAPLGLAGGVPASELVLGQGEVREILVTSAGSFLIHGNKPIWATQGMDCEGTLSAAVPVDTLWRDYRFALPANFDHELMVVRHDPMPVLLDGVPIAESLFQPAGGTFEAARVAVPPCVGLPSNCLHDLAGTFGLTLRGMDVLCAYALTPFITSRCGPVTGPDCIP
ncbi:MAG TPA: IgGFc-binding protein [Polyangia bacterium]|nr:IgGFc-binding protein [Polyangia bacterium]